MPHSNGGVPRAAPGCIPLHSVIEYDWVQPFAPGPCCAPLTPCPVTRGRLPPDHQGSCSAIGQHLSGPRPPATQLSEWPLVSPFSQLQSGTWWPSAERKVRSGSQPFPQGSQTHLLARGPVNWRGPGNRPGAVSWRAPEPVPRPHTGQTQALRWRWTSPHPPALWPNSSSLHKMQSGGAGLCRLGGLRSLRVRWVLGTGLPQWWQLDSVGNWLWRSLQLSSTSP